MRPSNLRASNWSGTVVRVMLTVALGVTAAAIVRGDIPSGMDGTITACYRANSTQQGSLRVIDAEAGEACGNGEASLTWNHMGVTGPMGPQGPSGPQGPAGTTATSDVYFTSFQTDVSEGGQGVLLGSSSSQGGTVLALDLPQGAYRVDARVDLAFSTTREGSSQVHCRLPGNAGTSALLDASERPGILQSSAVAQREITTVIDHAGGPLALTCWASSLSGVGSRVDNASLLATPVGAVHRP